MDSLSADTRIIQSLNDKRHYKVIHLDNQLAVLLISDPETDKSAASMNIHVGSCEDPKEFPGLAHFLEHMLFLGTEKYPDQSEYSAYLTANGGSNNAWTNLLDTNYYFDVSNKGFREALDRFAQFFIGPLFTQSCTDREMNAVNSEHEKNIMQDAWREFQLSRTTSVKDHPYNGFGTGNLSTLKKEGIREALINFHKKYYSANLMKLAIYGKDNIEVLEKMAFEIFSNIPNYNATRPKYTEPPFTKELLGNFWKVTPVKDQDYLKLTWIFPNMHEHYKSNPLNYISWLMGHEGEGSLTSLLINEGLILELTSSHSIVMNLFTKFTLSVQLTKKGLANYNNILNAIFSYLKLLREDGLREYIFNEIKDIKNIRFNFLDKTKPISYVPGLSNSMQYYPLDDILRLNFLMESYEPDIIQKYINGLKLDNARIFIYSKSVEGECDKVEEIYNIKYKYDNIYQQIYNDYQNPNLTWMNTQYKLYLPPSNKFIPKNFDVYYKENNNLAEYPHEIYNTGHTQIWFKQDNKFKVPKASVTIKLYSNDCGYGSFNKANLIVSIWIKLFNEYIRELKYTAQLAALNPSVEQDQNGIEIFCSGFNDSLSPFLNSLFESIKKFNPDKQREQFTNIVDKMIKTNKNFTKNMPVQQAHYLNSASIKSGGEYLHPNEAITILESITFEDILYFHKEWLKTTRAEGLLTGNMTAEQAKNLSADIEKHIRLIRESSKILHHEKIPQIRVAQLREKEIYLYEHKLITQEAQKESNCAIVSYFQHDPEKLRHRLLFRVLSNYLSEPCFNRLRTDEQLGYIANGTDLNQRGVLGYYIYVQSSVKCPQYISERILAFIDFMREKIKCINDNEFKMHVEAVRVKIIEKDLSIVQESQRFWNEIANHQFLFDRKEKSLKELESINKEELIDLFEDIFYNRRRLLETHVISEKFIEENEKLKNENKGKQKFYVEAATLDTFKRTLPLFPDFYSGILNCKQV